MPSTVFPEDSGSPEAEDKRRPVVALVLSGGGARGAAHAGILQLLERNRVPVDIVVGTSFGALVGGFYASGLSPEEITEWLENLDWASAASDRPTRRALSMRRKQDDTSYALRLQLGYRDGRIILPKGVLGAQELGFMLRSETQHAARWHDFDDYPIRLRTVATDIERGEPVVLSRGPLADALLASMAVPGVVAPFEIDGRILVDGGLVDNLPVNVAKRMGADVIIAVDVSTPLMHRDVLQDLLGVTAQVINMTGLQSMRDAIAALGPDDILIRPDLSGISSTDFDLMGEAIQRGLAADPVVTYRLRALAVDDATWSAWLEHHRMTDRAWPVVDFIEIDNPTIISDPLLRARVSLRTGEPLDPERLRRDVDSLYSLGEFERIDFRLEERDGEQGVIITVAPNPLGPNYLRFGVNIQDDLQGSGAYNLLFMHTRTQINALAGEWRNEFQIGETRRLASQFYQPLNWRGDFYISPSVEWRRTHFDIYDELGRQVAKYGFGSNSMGLEVGYQWKSFGEVAVGYFNQEINAELSIGDPSLPRFQERQAGWQWRITLDQLDSWTFPADAWYFELRGKHANSSFGGSLDYSRLAATFTRAWPVTENDRILWSINIGGRTTGTLPLYEAFPLGGFLSLSGYRRDELRGEFLFSTRLVWYRSVYQIAGAFGDKVYVGVSHEQGNAWVSRRDASLSDLHWGASVFVAADLVIGALYLGAGHGDNGKTAGYLFLQRSF